MLSEVRVAEIREACDKASPRPRQWSCDVAEEPVDDPKLKAQGIQTIPAAFKHIQLKGRGTHRFWVQVTDTQVGRDVVFDFDFVVGARE